MTDVLEIIEEKKKNYQKDIEQLQLKVKVLDDLLAELEPKEKVVADGVKEEVEEPTMVQRPEINLF